MPQVKVLTGDMLVEYSRLCSFAFQFDIPETELSELKKDSEKRETLGVVIDQQLASGMQIIPFETYLYGKRVKMGGIAGVATWPELRRQGCVQALLVDGLQRMRAAGQVLSFLFPFKHSFYRRYGWETTADSLNYSLRAQDLPQFPETDGQIKRWNGNLSVLDDIYQQHAARYNGTIARDKRWWKREVLKDNLHVYVYSVQGKAEGYLLFSVRKQEFTCREWVNLTPRSHYAFWNFIRQHDSMVDKVTWKAASDQIDVDLLPNPPRANPLSLSHMARIVDVGKFFADYPWPPVSTQFRAVIEILDPYASWNTGLWELVAGEAGIYMHKLESDSAHVDASMSIRTLTVLASGYRSLEQLCYVGRAKVCDEIRQQLASVFRAKVNYNPDHF